VETQCWSRPCDHGLESHSSGSESDIMLDPCVSHKLIGRRIQSSHLVICNPH